MSTTTAWPVHVIVWNVTAEEVEKRGTELESLVQANVRSYFGLNAEAEILFSFPTEVGLQASVKIPIRMVIIPRMPHIDFGSLNQSALTELTDEVTEEIHGWDNRKGVPVLVDL